MVTVVVGGNLLGQGTWEWFKSQNIQSQTRKEAKALFSYGNTKPLPTLGTFQQLSCPLTLLQPAKLIL